MNSGFVTTGRDDCRKGLVAQKHALLRPVRTGAWLELWAPEFPDAFVRLGRSLQFGHGGQRLPVFMPRLAGSRSRWLPGT